MKIVDLDTAKSLRGVRLVVPRGFPSPWSEAATQVLRLAEVGFVRVPTAPRDEATRAWTGVRNVPVLMFDDEPPRAGWQEIVALAERLGHGRLMPKASAERSAALGTIAGLAGERGTLWFGRLLMIDAGLRTEGKEGFPLPAAQYLAPLYGHTASEAAIARARVTEGLRHVASVLGEASWFGGEKPNAVDAYAATAVDMFAPLPHEVSPMSKFVRRAFEWLGRAMGPDLPASLVAHRDRFHEARGSLPFDHG